MASQKLRTGLEGVEPFVHFRLSDRAAIAHARPMAGEPCCCSSCQRRDQAIEWPRYHMGIPARLDRDAPSPDLLMSYECHLEGTSVDPDLAEILAEIRNDPRRDGSVIIAKKGQVPQVASLGPKARRSA